MIKRSTILGTPMTTGVHLSPANARYLDAKVRHTNHTINLDWAS